MSHTNKSHISYLIVTFYSWFLFSFSKCLHLKKYAFPEQHSTSTTLTFQLNVTSAYTDKKAKTFGLHQRLNCCIQELKTSLELMHALHVREHPSTHSCVAAAQRRTRYHLWLIHYSNRHQKVFLLQSTGVLRVSLIKFSTLKHVEERVEIISTFIQQAGDVATVAKTSVLSYTQKP